MVTVFGLFAKHPIPGKVKTRLAESIGPRRAALLAEAFLADLADRFESTADRRLLAYAPAHSTAARYFQHLSRGRYQLWPQPEGSLGVRMEAFFANQFSSPGVDHEREADSRRGHSFHHAAAPSAVVLIGSDSPTLPKSFVDDAFAALASADCVLGPADDGGYYLIGLSCPVAGLFDNVAWGGPHVLEETIANISAAGLRLHLLPPWYDIDILADVDTLREQIASMRATGEADLPRRTLRVITQLDLPR